MPATNYPDARSRIQQGYQTSLGREGSDDEINTHLRNVGYQFDGRPITGVEQILGAIAGSDEAKNRTMPVGTPAPGPTPPTAPPPPVTAPSGAGWNGLNLGFGGQQNTAQFRGFNDDRALAGGDPNSVKDAFRRFIGSQPWNGDSSKEGLDTWMTGLLPQARQYGLNILDVVGDQILVETKERGPEWVDYYQNAGGEDGAFQWLTQQEFGTQPDAAFGKGLNDLRGLPGGADILAALMADGGMQGNTLMQQIQAELQRLLKGQPATTPTLPVPGGGGGGGTTSPYPEI